MNVKLRNDWCEAVVDYSKEKSLSNIKKAEAVLKSIRESKIDFKPLGELSVELIKGIEEKSFVEINAVVLSKCVDTYSIGIRRNSTKPTIEGNENILAVVKGEMNIGDNILLKACNIKIAKSDNLETYGVEVNSEDIQEYELSKSEKIDDVVSVIKKANKMGMVEEGLKVELSKANILHTGNKPKKETSGSVGLEITELFKSDSLLKEGIIKGVVYAPEEVDLQGDIASEVEIEKACHGFMMNYLCLNIEHKVSIDDSQASVVENYIAPCDFIEGRQKIKKGSWVVAVQLFDEDLKRAYQSGELTGFSFEGDAKI